MIISFSQFYRRIERELAEREKFEALYVKRQELLLELERAHRATQLWIQQQAQSKAISDQQTQNIDYIFGEVDLLRSQLERQSGLFFNQSHQLLDQSSNYVIVMVIHNYMILNPLYKSPIMIAYKTFGRSIQI